MTTLLIEPAFVAATEGYKDGDTVSLTVTGTLSSKPDGSKTLNVTNIAEAETPEESASPTEEADVEMPETGSPAVGMMMAKRAGKA